MRLYPYIYYLQQYRHHSLVQVLSSGQAGEVLFVFLGPCLRPLPRVPRVLQRPLDSPGGGEVRAEAPGHTGHDSWQLLTAGRLSPLISLQRCTLSPAAAAQLSHTAGQYYVTMFNVVYPFKSYLLTSQVC